MSGFFPIFPGGGGGGGGQNPANAFTGVQLVGDNLVFTRDGGGFASVNLSQIVPTDSVTKVELNDTTLVVTKKDGSIENIDLKPILTATNTSFDNTGTGLTSQNVQDAIEEVDKKINDAYINSNYAEATGEFNLIKADGSKDTYRLAGLDAENVFTKVNVMPDLLLSGVSFSNKHYSTHETTTANRVCAIRSQSSDLFHDGYVESLRVYLKDNPNNVVKILDVNVWEVSKTDDISNDIIVANHTNNVSFDIIVDANTQLSYIEIPINKTYATPTYFATRITGTSGCTFVALSNIDNAEIQKDFINAGVSANQVVVGANIANLATQSNRYCIYTEIRGRISVEDKLMSSYTISDYNDQTGKLTLTRHDGTTNTHTLSVGGNYVQHFNYDSNTRTIEVTDENGQQHTIEHIITEWLDLEHVHEITKQNIFNPVTQLIKGSYYLNSGNGTVTNDTAGVGWARTVVPLTTQGVYTIYTTKHASQTFVYLDAGGTPIQRVVVNPTTNNSVKFTKRYRLDATNHPVDAVAFGFNIITNEAHSDHVDPINEIMIFAEDLTENLNEFIPRTNGAEIIINGAKVSVGFDPSDSELLSTTVESAIKEIDNKIVTINNSTVKTVNGVNPDTATGNVQVEIANITNLQTTLNEKVAQTDLTVVTSPDKVLQLDRNGKIDTSVLPDLSINQVYSVQSEQEAMDLINANTAQIGDVFIVEDNGNRVYMYVNDQGADFTDKCVELTMGNGVVVKVNNEVADATGNVTIRANHITLSNGTSNVEAELNKRLQTINSQTGTDGNINLSIDITDSKINFQVEGVNFGELTYIDDAQVQDIITLFD